MIRFLITFFLIYGFAHLYFYRKLFSTISLKSFYRIVIIILLIFLAVAPVTVRYIERFGYESAARAIAYPAYFWMSFLFLFLVVSLFLHLVKICICNLSRKKTTNQALAGFSVTSFCIPALLAFSVTFYGYFEAKNIRIENVTVKSKKLDSGESFKIALISDVHLGILTDRSRMDRIFRLLEGSGADAIVSAGDLIDGYLTDNGEYIDMFRTLKSRYGSYCVMGNHEYYVGYDKSAELIKRGGFSLLRGEAVILGKIRLVGDDDITAKRFGIYKAISAKPDAGLFTLLVRHQPLLTPDIKADFQFSGHLHKGQIFPFGFFAWLRYRVNTGLTDMKDGRFLYVGRGTGTWGPPVRFLAPPEITLLEVRGE